jgi:hypothetical protein
MDYSTRLRLWTWAQGAANLPLILHRPGAKTAAFTLKPRMIGTVPLEPCRTVDGNTEGLCGTVSVWENRELKLGRRLALKVMVLPAPEGGAADAFFPLAGGTGTERHRDVSGDGLYERYPQGA